MLQSNSAIQIKTTIKDIIALNRLSLFTYKWPIFMNNQLFIMIILIMIKINNKLTYFHFFLFLKICYHI